MLGSIKEFKYKKIKNFLSMEETKLMCDYVEYYHKYNQYDYGVDMQQSSVYDTKGSSKLIFEILLENKRKKMEELTGLNLFPTYSFFRMYTKFSDLKKHKDRPSCEISVTVCLGSDGTSWPIYMDGQAIDLEPGDAAIYLGCDLSHWRNKFLGDWHAQCFLHYVDANGQFKDYKYDKRNKLGDKE